MSKLIEQFASQRAMFEKQLRETRNLPQALATVRQTIQAWAALDGDYMRRLSVGQARTASTMLNVLADSLTLLSNIQIEQQQVRTRPHDPDWTTSKQTKLMGTAITSSVLGSGAVALMGGPVGVVASIVIGAAVGIGANQLPADAESETLANAARVVYIKIAPENVLHYMEQAVTTIDSVVDQIDSGVTQPKTAPKLTELTDIVEFLQNLAGDALDESIREIPTIHKRLQQVDTLLRHHGITLRRYDVTMDDETAWRLFDFEQNLDATETEIETLKPAVVKDDEVLLRGLVMRPQAG